MQQFPIIVVGAGAGGLVIAIGAARAGKRVLLIEEGNWGGDCSNFGCIPSKTIIATAAKGETDGVFAHVRSVVHEVRSGEEPGALQAMGVETAEGQASFIDPHTLHVEGFGKVQGKQIVLATGSSPRIPNIPGLSEVDFLTNETLFSLEKVPKSLLIVGGGPIGCELGQAFNRLGCHVTIIQRHTHLTMREEPEAQEALAKKLREEGVDLVLGQEPEEVAPGIEMKIGGRTLRAEKLLVASGRTPTLKPLRLERAQVAYSESGIATDAYGRTNQKHIWAIGDATGPPFFTHRAENQARAVLMSLLLPPYLKKRISKQEMPRVTYSDPEIASIGMLESEAIKKWGEKRVATYTVPLDSVDRAIATGRREGFVKIVTKRWSSRIVGACLVTPSAGEILPQLSMMMQRRIPLRKAASLIYPYPTYSGAIRKAADLWFTKTLLGARKR